METVGLGATGGATMLIGVMIDGGLIASAPGKLGNPVTWSVIGDAPGLVATPDPVVMGVGPCICSSGGLAEPEEALRGRA